MWTLRMCLTLLAVTGALLAGQGGIGQGVKTAAQTQALGDPVRGQAIFGGKGACLSCHRVSDEGSRMGPDLSAIATQRTLEELQISLLNPNPDVQPRNQLYRVVTRDGTTTTGKLLNQDEFSLQMLDSKERLRSFDKSKLLRYSFMQTPPMSSYKDKLNAEEQRDLIAYLASLRGVARQ